MGAAPLRRWHLVLIDRLRAIPGVVPSVVASTEKAVDPHRLDRLFRMEGYLHGLEPGGLFAPVSVLEAGAVAFVERDEADLVLDLGGASSDATRRWELRFDGKAGEAALVSVLLAGNVPLVELTENGAPVAAARPGSEHGRILRAKLDDILSRIVTLITAAVDGGRMSVPRLPAQVETQPAPRTGPAQRMVKAALSTAVDRIYRRCFHAPHWRVGWRRLVGPDLLDLRHHPETGWQDLPDDGTRFYADPFPVMHQGRLTLFVEDFVHAIGKGIISAVEFGPDGPIGRPEPVLEEPGHLSYPFVFERDGQVWMIPESSGAARVDLFRATAFPGGWVREATLIEGLVASDATLIERDGLWWLFATVRDGGGSFSDALHLWSAPDFRGPWTPHRRNPVLIDIASARPAGQMRVRDGALLRAVQDCRFGYGKALGIARVTRLDREGFEQRLETIIEAGPLWPGRRIHTLNSAGGYEFIDGSAMARRPLLARRPSGAGPVGS